jgi:hypothetical protein
VRAKGEEKTMTIRTIFTAVLLIATPCSALWAQERREADSAMLSSREAAPIDLEGYWTTLITEDWRWRMVTPPKGDISSFTFLNDEAIRVTNEWDPQRDEGTCRPYGAGNLMRMPIRVHITWEDEDTLKLESDHGMQTRYFHFNAEDLIESEASWQGVSLASWEGQTLKVVTRNLRPGYIRRNGVPYSENTVVTEYFNRHDTYGDQWFVVSVLVNDPHYYTEPYFSSSSFKYLPNGSEWNPLPCADR